MNLIINEKIEVAIETSAETGRIDKVWVEGKNLADLSFADALLEIIGPLQWSMKVSEAALKAQEICAPV